MPKIEHGPSATNDSDRNRAELFRGKARALRVLADTELNLKTKEGYTAAAAVWDTFAEGLVNPSHRSLLMKGANRIRLFSAKARRRVI